LHHHLSHLQNFFSDRYLLIKANDRISQEKKLLFWGRKKNSNSIWMKEKIQNKKKIKDLCFSQILLMFIYFTFTCNLQLYNKSNFWTLNWGHIFCHAKYELVHSQVSISSTFYARVFHMKARFSYESAFLAPKFCTKVLRSAKFRTKNARVKCWWNWLQERCKVKAA